jgi:hypothetical protein
MLPFFLLGVVQALRRRDRVALMIGAVVAAYFLMRAYLGGSEVSRLPVDPLIIVLGFYGAASIGGAFRGNRSSGREQATS